MTSATIDVSSVIAACKDELTAEWADYKKSGKLKRTPVCRYSVGGPRDNPVAALSSVAKGVTQWQQLLRDVVDCKKPEGSPLLESEMVVGADCSVSVYPERHYKGEAPHTNFYTVSATTPAPTSGNSMPLLSNFSKLYYF